MQPSLPAKIIDKQFLEAAFQSGIGPKGDVWFAPSFVAMEHDMLTFGSVFVANLQSDWTLAPSDIGYEQSNQQFYVTESNHSLAVKPFSSANPLILKVMIALI